MTYQLTGGRWGWSLRGWLTPGMLTLPLLVLLFVPIAFGLPYLYIWTDHAAVMASKSLSHKAVYLNVPFFLGRAALYFVIWLIWGIVTARVVPLGDEQPSEARARFIQRWSAAGLVMLVLTVSFAAIDWVGSLEAEWYSTIYGIYIFIAQVLTAWTMAVAGLLVWQRRQGQDKEELDPLLLRDLGNLLLMLVVLHAYFAFSQFFVIWNGNLPEEIIWYVPRTQGIWGAIALVIMIGHFFLPFAALTISSR